MPTNERDQLDALIN
jgi:hypothetical protein